MNKLSLDVDRLNSELNRRKWNKTRLAKEMGVSKQRVSHILSKPESATLQTIENIARALHIPGTDLLWDFAHTEMKKHERQSAA